jgi:hypothetical protein
MRFGAQHATTSPRLRRRRIWVYVGLFACGFAASAVVVPMSLTASTRTAAAVPLGDYAGYTDTSGLQQFGSATTTHPTMATDYLAGTGTWSDMVSSAQGLSAWKGYRLVLGVPLIPGSSGGTLAQGAAGSYNQYFTQVASQLVSAGQSDAILRLGWEFNGNWMPWSLSDSTDAANFAAFWRQVVGAMRAVPGAQFGFLWNPNSGSGPSNFSADQAYPGDAYVDYVGLDMYDECWCSPQTPQNSWSTDLSEQWGLDWLAGFSAQHGKPMAFPEWSVAIRSDGHGLGDDPYFVNQFANWVATNDVAFTDIFSYNDSVGGQDGDITDGNFPNALAAFRQDFGGASAALPAGNPAPAPAPAPAPVPVAPPHPAPAPVPITKPAPAPAPRPVHAPSPVHVTPSPVRAPAPVQIADAGRVKSGVADIPTTAAGGAPSPATRAVESPGLTLHPRVGVSGTSPLTPAAAALSGAAGPGINLVGVVGMFLLGGVIGLGVALRRERSAPRHGRARLPALTG